MKIEASGKLSQKIAVLAEKLWLRYLCHPFITQMADGTLPLEKFRYYMLQDYLYLRDYTKILAAILQKADTFEQIRFLSGEIESTLGETYRTHIPYMQRLGITEEEIRQAHTHIDNCAYSHYMLCETQNGNVLTGLVALLNCSWSYAYIAEQMVQRYPQALQNKTYGAWFAGYLSEEYRKANQDLIDRIDALAASISPQEENRLCELFEKCCLFDLRFWDMAYAIPSVHCILGARSMVRKHLPTSHWVRRSTTSMQMWPMRSSSMLLSPTILTTLPTKRPRFCAKQPASGRMWAALPSAAAANTASAP